MPYDSTNIYSIYINKHRDDSILYDILKMKRKENIKMWELEAIRIMIVGCAGIMIGLTFGYVAGHDRGHKQGYEQAKRDDVISHRYKYGGF